MNQVFTTFIIFIFLCTSGADSDHQLDKLSWLIGDWTSDNNSTIISENWTKVSNMSFEGYGLIRTNNETGNKIFETLRIVDMSDHIYYLAKVAHNDLPIAFH